MRYGDKERETTRTKEERERTSMRSDNEEGDAEDRESVWSKGRPQGRERYTRKTLRGRTCGTEREKDYNKD